MSFATLFFACQPDKIEFNNFSSSTDTLVISMEKQMGFGVFPSNAGGLYMKDTTGDFVTNIIYPTAFDSIRRTERFVDYSAMKFHAYKKGHEELLEYVLEDIKLKRIDTSMCLPEIENCINILEGYKDGKRIIIVDGNNNKDLTDDNMYVVDELVWEEPDDLVECSFRIFDGQKIVPGKSWLGFRKIEGENELLIGKSEHIVAEFHIDGNLFTIAAINSGSADFTYDLSNRLLFTILKDGEGDLVYTKGDFLKLGQFLRLKDEYYLIHSISHNGGKLTLFKERNFKKRIGTQVGMIAPEFECVLLSGDTISSATLRDKGIIVVNTCGCGGDSESIISYNEIADLYGRDFYVLGVDSQFDSDQEGLLINTDNPFNKDFYNKYRMMYCSRMTYVIGMNSRIRQIFSLQDWQRKNIEIIDSSL